LKKEDGEGVSQNSFAAIGLIQSGAKLLRLIFMGFMAIVII